MSAVVVATTTDPADDPIAGLAADLGVGVHRGSTHDVLRRCLDAVEAFEPEVVIRQTADNPSPTLRWPRSGPGALDGGLDYVGIDGWPLGIAAEACRFPALAVANREATDPADREHVTPFLYRQPERFRSAGHRADSGRAAAASARYTVDTEPDLAFARALAAQLSAGPPVSLAVLEAIIEDDPALLEINAGVAQKPWGTSQLAEEARWTS